MEVDITQLNPSDYAAWWGAVIATLALIWNIVVAIRSGARIHVNTSPNMKIFPPNPGQEDKTYILVNAVNRGSSSTTITHFLGFSTDNILGLVSTRYRQNFIVNGTPDSNTVPYKLAPGDEWRGMADQAVMLDDVCKKFLYLGVQHNQSKHPIYKRVRIGE